MKKIVIIADSLSLPRPKELGDIPYEGTYPYLLDMGLRTKLGNNAPVVMEKGKRARTITDVKNDWVEYVSWRKPEVVIVHVGIVDCAPRVFLPQQKVFVDRIRVLWLRKLILHFVKKYRRNIIRLFPNRVYTPFDFYKATVQHIIELAMQDKIKALIFINTISPPDSFEYRSPGCQKNVEMYNKILYQATLNKDVYLIDINKIFSEGGLLDKYITNDCHHLTVEGNKVLAIHLQNLLLDIFM